MYIYFMHIYMHIKKWNNKIFEKCKKKKENINKKMKRKKRDERKAEREERSQVERDNQFRRVTMLFFPSFYI